MIVKIYVPVRQRVAPSPIGAVSVARGNGKTFDWITQNGTFCLRGGVLEGGFV